MACCPVVVSGDVQLPAGLLDIFRGNRMAAQHAHNIFLDPPLSFGIVGILLILPYFISCIKRTYITYKLHKNDTLVALIIGLIVMTYIHGLLDYTIFFIQTSFTLFIVISSFDIYRGEIDMYKK